MPRAILTGGPGAGKTTLLIALAERGQKTVGESAREVIAERRRQGKSPRPAPVEFAKAILQRDCAKYHVAAPMPEWTLFDRGAIEAIGGLHAVEPLAEAALHRLLNEYKVEMVFMLPPWPEIYTMDAERDQTVEEAGKVYELILAWYRITGYNPILVPRTAVAERASFVLQALGDASPLAPAEVHRVP